VLTQTNDGFVVAEKDLEIRGPGEFLGFRQSGLPDLLLADLVKDTKILEEARNCALKLVKEDPDFIQNPALKALIDQKTEKGQGEILHSG
jgi:ATP-dependent DNA helicase RecG